MPRSPFGWDYPPGVTGNEPQITGGEDKCDICGSEMVYTDEECDLLMCPTPEKHPPAPICIKCKRKCHPDDVYGTKEGTVCLSCGEEEDRKREHAEAVVEASRRFQV